VRSWCLIYKDYNFVYTLDLSKSAVHVDRDDDGKKKEKSPPDTAERLSLLGKGGDAFVLGVDPLVDFLDVPSAHPALAGFVLLAHGVAEAEVLAHGAGIVLPPELQALVQALTRLAAIVKALVSLLLQVVQLVLVLHVPDVLLVVEVLPVVVLIILVQVVPHIVQVVVVHVVPVLELLH